MVQGYGTDPGSTSVPAVDSRLRGLITSQKKQGRAGGKKRRTRPPLLAATATPFRKNGHGSRTHSRHSRVLANGMTVQPTCVQLATNPPST